MIAVLAALVCVNCLNAINGHPAILDEQVGYESGLMEELRVLVEGRAVKSASSQKRMIILRDVREAERGVDVAPSFPHSVTSLGAYGIRAVQRTGLVRSQLPLLTYRTRESGHAAFFQGVTCADVERCRWGSPDVSERKFEADRTIAHGGLDLRGQNPRASVLPHLFQLVSAQAGLPGSNASISDDGDHADKLNPKHWWIMQPLLLLAAGIGVLGWGGRRLYECSGWWPDDLPAVAWGLPAVLGGGGLIFFGTLWFFGHV
jgi:hypothetical protein